MYNQNQNYQQQQQPQYQQQYQYEETYEETVYQPGYHPPQGYQQEGYQQQQPVYQQQYQQQQYQQQPQQPLQNQQNQDYFQQFQTSATGQIGMQLGSQALHQAQQQLQTNVHRYFDINQWRYYFNVSNSYVFNKLRLLLFPFLQKSWVRTVEHGDDHTKVGSFAPPRADLNAPDLYIPAMSFVTYVILVGIATGINAKGNTAQTFSPDVLGLTASTGFFMIAFEVVFIKIGCYFLNITSNVSFLELFAYTGYKFVPINAVLTTKLFSMGWFTVGLFSYMFFAFGFFTLRSLRGMVLPDAASTMNEVGGAARKQRVVFLFIIALLETFTSWILI